MNTHTGRANRHRGKRPGGGHFGRGIAAALLALALMGCTANPAPRPAEQSNAELEQLKADKSQLEAQVAQLQADLQEAKASKETKEGKPTSPQLINTTYLNEKADADPLAYRKTVTADLNGDGKEETVTVATTAQADPKTGQFAWDDGQPWFVYVDEADGTRTTIFANWVQLGQLRVMIGEQPTSVIIASEQGAGTNIYRVTYRGPQQTEAVELASFLTINQATFPPGFNFAE